MELNYKDILTTFMVLFAVIDIIGNIPIIIDLRKKAGHIQSEKASIIAGFILIIFLFVGEQLLSIIGLDVHSFAIAGSLIIFFIALEMILGIKIYKEEKNPLNATVFPLAFPLIAGPGSLTTLLSLKAAFSNANIIVAIIINIVVIYIVLKASSKIEKIIGENGIGIIRKIFGVVLLAISIKLFTTNIKFLL
ncbi:MAG: MarC family protein [Flavobacteriales bacterium]|jgi:multiple antibiotic resistance protein|tara:strand:+ start:3771 stop:4346 length:576 start_codon:yes stop_codon:yes gene_type:complete